MKLYGFLILTFHFLDSALFLLIIFYPETVKICEISL